MTQNDKLNTKCSNIQSITRSRRTLKNKSHDKSNKT